MAFQCVLIAFCASVATSIEMPDATPLFAVSFTSNVTVLMPGRNANHGTPVAVVSAVVEHVSVDDVDDASSFDRHVIVAVAEPTPAPPRRNPNTCKMPRLYGVSGRS